MPRGQPQAGEVWLQRAGHIAVLSHVTATCVLLIRVWNNATKVWTNEVSLANFLATWRHSDEVFPEKSLWERYVRQALPMQILAAEIEVPEQEAGVLYVQEVSFALQRLGTEDPLRDLLQCLVSFELLRDLIQQNSRSPQFMTHILAGISGLTAKTDSAGIAWDLLEEET